MLAHSLTKVWRVQVVESQSNSLNLLFFFTALQDRRHTAQFFVSVWCVGPPRPPRRLASCSPRWTLCRSDTAPSHAPPNCSIPAGTVCSSTRAELVAMRAALEEVPQLGDDLDETPLMLCTDSQAALATLASSVGAQKTALGATSSRRPRKRADRSAYIGTSPLRAPRKWTCGRAGERGL